MFLVMHTTLCSWNEGLTQMMTRKTKVIIKHNERYLRLRREGRNQLMVSQEQMPFMFLVMLHLLLKWRISSNTWCEKLKWQYSTIRMSEYDGEGRNQQAVHSITVCQEQMPGWSIAGIKNIEWLVPFQWFNSSFSIWWLVNHQCGQKKSVSAAYQPSLDQSTTVRKTDTYVLLLSG